MKVGRKGEIRETITERGYDIMNPCKQTCINYEKMWGVKKAVNHMNY